MKRGIIWNIAIFGGLCLTLGAQTTFLADFEKDLDAAYAAGSPKPQFSPHFNTNSLKQVEGKFGRGLLVEKGVYQFSFGYETAKNFAHEQGTLEFWFRPEWDSNYKDPNDPAWLKPYASSSFMIFSTLEPPTGYRLDKNQYNCLSFGYAYSYVTAPSVSSLPPGPGPLYWKKGDWVYLAAAWDRNDGRLFLNGKLIGCKDDWQVLTPYEYRMYFSGWGTFDDIRVSRDKRYIASFPVPTAPLAVEREQPLPAPQVPADEKAALERDHVSLFVDFKDGLIARFAAGEARGMANRPLTIDPLDGAPALRLSRQGVGPQLAVWFPARENVNQFLGTIEIVFRLAASNAYPAVLWDLTDLESIKNVVVSQRSGMRLVMKDATTLEWQNWAGGAVVAAVQVSPVTLRTDTWNRIACSWGNAAITLTQDGQVLKKTIGVPLPHKLSNYLYLGADSVGERTCEGWIKQIKVTRR